MAEYKTHQRETIINFLSANTEKQYSVEELADALDRAYGDSAPGKSTVYRLINRLCEDGTVKRFEKNSSKQFVYQLAGGDECHHHLHMKCLDCGKLMHMEHDLSEEVIELIFGDSSFSVDKEQTTIFGHCENCRKAEV